MRLFQELISFSILLFVAVHGRNDDEELQQTLTRDSNEVEYYSSNSTVTNSQYKLVQVTEPYQHPEGPLWDHRTNSFYFMDVHNKRVYKLDPATGEITYVYIDNGILGFVIPIENSTDQFIVASLKDLLLVNWNSDSNSTDPTYEKLVTIDTDRVETVFNDGKADSHGRIWGGTKGPAVGTDSVPNQGSLYRFTNDLIPTRVLCPVTISNGLAWNKEDNAFYYVDSHNYNILGFDYDCVNGTISNERIVFDVKEANMTGFPDGMTIDTDGNLWVALFNGHHVICVDPRNGTVIQSIKMPARDVTSLIFGGENFDILYVTTSKLNLNDTEILLQPLAGSVFTIEGLGVTGSPTYFYAKN